MCEDLPVQIKEYLTYCRKLGFDQSPDYRQLRRLFKNALEERVGYDETVLSLEIKE